MILRPFLNRTFSYLKILKELSKSGIVTLVLISVAFGLLALASLDRFLAILGLLAVFSYNILYTLWWKKYWAYGAVPGAIPGALPILMGYASAKGNFFHPGGIYLFLLLFFWQM